MLPIDCQIFLFNGIVYGLTNCLPACLIPSDKRNLVMAKITGQIFFTPVIIMLQKVNKPTKNFKFD